MSSELQTDRDDTGKRPVGDAVDTSRLGSRSWTTPTLADVGCPLAAAQSGHVQFVGQRLHEAMRVALKAPERHDPAASGAAVERPLGAAMPRILGPLRKPVHVVTRRREALHAAA